MTSSVPVASKNKTIPISLRWFENEVVFSVDDRHSICLKYNPNEHILKFSSPSISKLSANSNGNNEFDFEQLLSILQPTSSNKCKRVFIEWCDMQCGQYLYYNLINILNVSKDISIDTNCFSSQKSTSDDSISNLPKFEAEFDESIDINVHLSSNDIIILAPIRSILRRFTNMGVFHDHILYLGPMPTVDFLRECKILLVFNCCMSGNRKDVMNAKTNLPQMREKLFNICKWKMNTEYNYNLDEDNVTLDIGSDSNTNNNGGQGNIIKLESMPFLDRMIDLIDKHLHIGHVLIHCLAGAHRSPFITGCYFLKYDGYLNKENAVIDIYQEMKKKRRIVQELGYDRRMREYQEFLLLSTKPSNSKFKKK